LPLAIQKGRIANLVDHTILFARDGTEIPVDESGCTYHGLRSQTCRSRFDFSRHYRISGRRSSTVS